MDRICPFLSGPIQVIEDGRWTGSAVFPVECLKERCIAWGDIGGPIQSPFHGCRLIERETDYEPLIEMPAAIAGERRRAGSISTPGEGSTFVFTIPAA